MPTSSSTRDISTPGGGGGGGGGGGDVNPKTTRTRPNPTLHKENPRCPENTSPLAGTVASKPSKTASASHRCRSARQQSRRMPLARRGSGERSLRPAPAELRGQPGPDRFASQLPVPGGSGYSLFLTPTKSVCSPSSRAPQATSSACESSGPTRRGPHRGPRQAGGREQLPDRQPLAAGARQLRLGLKPGGTAAVEVLEAKEAPRPQNGQCGSAKPQ